MSAPALRPSASPPPLLARWAEALRRVRVVLHAIMGVPDYDGYVRHLRDRHPDCPVPSRRDFERERLKARYERPGSRCC